MTYFLRRPSCTPGGYAVGGGDTTWHRTSQPSFWSVRLDANIEAAGAKVKAEFPAGMIILERWVVPDPENPPTTGTIEIDDLDNLVSYGTGLDATTIARDPLVTSGLLNERTEFTFSTAGIDGAVYVGFYAIPPMIRR